MIKSLKDLKNVPCVHNMSGSRTATESNEKWFSHSLRVITCPVSVIVLNSALLTLIVTNRNTVVFFSRWRYWFFKLSQCPVCNVPAPPSLSLLLSHQPSTSHRATNHLSVLSFSCVSRLLSDGWIRMRWQHCATQAADPGRSLVHCCSGQPSQGRRLWMWRSVKPNIWEVSNNWMGFYLEQELIQCFCQYISISFSCI